MIERCECFAMQPEDRDYNANGKKREARMEILGGVCPTASDADASTGCSYGRKPMNAKKAGSLNKYGFDQADSVY